MQVFTLWPYTIIFFLAFALIVFYVMTRNREIMLKICIGLFAFSFITGFAFYSYGFLFAGDTPVEVPIAALRALFSTTRMFFIIEDYDTLASFVGSQWLTDNIGLRILFWVCHITAMIVIQAALLSLFGRRFLDTFRLRCGSHKDLYIIKGEAGNSFLLGENIATHDASLKRYDSSRLIVFLSEDGDDVKNLYEKAAGFGGIVLLPGRNRSLIYYLNRAGFGKPDRRDIKYNIILMPNNVPAGDEARRIAEYAIGKVEPEKLDIFVLTPSEFEREEIEKIAQLKENGHRKYPFTFHIVSEVDLFIRQMLEKHPLFECHSFDKVCDFKVMVLGFGNVGQHALLRLIMNGQFAGSRMRAIVIDKDMDSLRDRFQYRFPGLDLCCDLDFIGVDVQSRNFFDFLNEIDDLYYIVIALDDDEKCKQTASDLRLHYERKDDGDLPYIAIIEKSGGRQSEYLSENIFSFGLREDVYKESIIIREEADIMAKAVNDTYSGGKQPWHELDWFTQESNRASADFIPAMLEMAGLDVETAADKDMLSEDESLSETLAQTEHLRWMAFHAAMGYSLMSLAEMKRRFETYSGSESPLSYCRRDPIAKQHICLASWEELDEVSEAYRDLARRANDSEEQKRDFKENDRDIIKNIPKFLRSVN